MNVLKDNILNIKGILSPFASGKHLDLLELISLTMVTDSTRQTLEKSLFILSSMISLGGPQYNCVECSCTSHFSFRHSSGQSGFALACSFLARLGCVSVTSMKARAEQA